MNASAIHINLFHIVSSPPRWLYPRKFITSYEGLIIKRFRNLKTTLLSGVFCLVATLGAAQTLTIFAAASLKTALDEIAADFEASQGASLRIAYAGSAVLARQIQQGAPADVYISASVDWMDVLETRLPIVAQTRRDIIGNRLVLIAGNAPDRETEPWLADGLAARIGARKLAMGFVDAVPAGQYGKAALQATGNWQALQGNIVQTENVRLALALVARKEVGFGIVYASDAHAEPKVTVLMEFDAGDYPDIRYPAAVVRDANAGLGGSFLEYLQSPEAQSVFLKNQFRPANDG